MQDDYSKERARILIFQFAQDNTYEIKLVEAVMGAQEKTEIVLRKIHVFFSKAEPYNGSKRSVVVDKNAMMDLLKELNDCIYEMMDEYELTEQSRDKADRRQKKMADERVFEARKNAEDIYAASLMFSDRTLNDLVDELDDAKAQIDRIHSELSQKIDREKSKIKDNSLDLKASFQDLIDTQKYMRLIEDENERIRKEKEAGNPERLSADSKPSYADVVPEIKINQEYFIKTGQKGAASDEVPDDTESPASTGGQTQTAGNKATGQTKTDIGPDGDISIDLDNEYFDWKKDSKKPESEKEKAKRKGFSLFGKKD